MIYRETNCEIFSDAFIPFICQAHTHIKEEKVCLAKRLIGVDSRIECITVKLVVKKQFGVVKRTIDKPYLISKADSVLIVLTKVQLIAKR